MLAIALNDGRDVGSLEQHSKIIEFANLDIVFFPEFREDTDWNSEDDDNSYKITPKTKTSDFSEYVPLDIYSGA